jgi:hypothetical protein
MVCGTAALGTSLSTAIGDVPQTLSLDFWGVLLALDKTEQFAFENGLRDLLPRLRDQYQDFEFSHFLFPTEHVRERCIEVKRVSSVAKYSLAELGIGLGVGAKSRNPG